ncbi:phosphoenolpyruvate synthase [Nocardioidaceae bacterium SCSIO 66511]|nr:phosphoenolpyruvate synthase [Nocardioidaceae bacterium SCSIO 66511]
MGQTIGIDRIDRRHLTKVGGKAANLGELSRLAGVRVPAGFCVTTDAYRQVVATHASFDELLVRLSRAEPDDHAAIRTLSAEARSVVESIELPNDLVAEISEELARLGENAAYAVRSSATAEDLPTASFAGQQDSYLNVTGLHDVLRHVRRCWASLFTERAVTYRLHNGFDHLRVQMAVIVQRLVSADAAGVLFTADPVTSNRKITTVEAVRGLGEALVSGLATGDVYAVHDDQVIDSTITETRPMLTQAQVVDLARLGRLIETHFGRPQDIEWCLDADGFQIVQSRPITTLFPVPETDDGENHVYVSVGHQQMMTDAMKPLGLSVWQLTTPRPMHEAGGRLFVDVAPVLATPAGRQQLVGTLGRSDPLIRDALQTILDRDGYLPTLPDQTATAIPARTATTAIENDPAIVTDLVERGRKSVAALDHALQTASGPAVFDVIRTDTDELTRTITDPRSIRVIMASMDAAWWLNDHLEEWLGEKNVADTLAQSAPHNVTSQMGLALLDVADAIRPHPDVVAYLQRLVDEGREDEDVLEGLAAVPGGQESRAALSGYLDEYGMRCAGEIDITRPRWSERPSTLLPTILGHVRNFEPGESSRRFEAGLRESERMEADVLSRLRELTDGAAKAEETKRMIDRLRTFAGYREYPKYDIISRYYLYKQALLREADGLVDAGALRTKEDCFYLRFEELRDAVRTQVVDNDLIDARREAFASYEALIPPRVLTSDGEVVTGEYRRDDVPPGALVGLPVSAGVIEGRARVVTDMTRADLEPGDILVTAFTDPSWTPLFVTVAGLVTEVGGLMTHGAVIAREYGLPAVVGVERATRAIRDGQRIRVHGTHGHVELLD